MSKEPSRVGGDLQRVPNQNLDPGGQIGPVDVGPRLLGLVPVILDGDDLRALPEFSPHEYRGVAYKGAHLQDAPRPVSVHRLGENPPPA